MEVDSSNEAIVACHSTLLALQAQHDTHYRMLTLLSLVQVDSEAIHVWFASACEAVIKLAA